MEAWGLHRSGIETPKRHVELRPPAALLKHFVQLSGKRPPDAPVYLVDVRLCGEPLVEPGADALNVPWQKLCDAIDWMIGDALDHMPQIGLGIEAVRLCGLIRL